MRETLALPAEVAAIVWDWGHGPDLVMRDGLSRCQAMVAAAIAAVDEGAHMLGVATVERVVRIVGMCPAERALIEGVQIADLDVVGGVGVYQYKVTDIEFMGKPDPKKAQQQCDEMGAAGWRLASSAAEAQAGGGRVMLFWERQKPQ